MIRQPTLSSNGMRDPGDIHDRGDVGDGEPDAASTAPRWLNTSEDRAWRRFMSMQIQLRRLLGRELQSETGLSEADYIVLVHLSETPGGRLRPFELGRAAGWEKSRLSHHLTRMERRGLVLRQNCLTDNRGAFVTLTAAGRSAIEAAAPFHVEQVRRWFLSALTSDQLEALTAISDAVLAGLDPVDVECEPEGDAEWMAEALDQRSTEAGEAV
jgi:DNA-binding MarR family transcriptional regulator